MRVSVLGGVLCFLFVSIGNADPASAATRKPTNIPAEPLDLALKTLAKERQFQVLFRAELARDVRTGGAVGEFTAEEAIKQLLSGTGLSYKYLDPQTVTVFAQTSQTANPVPSGVTPHDGDELNKEAGKKSSQDFRLAQVDQGQTSSPSTVEKPDEQPSKKKPDQLEEVIVTGSRIPTAAGQLTLPVLSYSREDIDNSGQTTIGEYLNTLPDVSTSDNSSFPNVGVAGMQSIQLHGLPVGTTLTLLDGQRLEKNFFGFFDLSNIPLVAVERIEILPVGASAIYGADGLGGAVNTILRKNFNGLEANATWENAPDVNNGSASLAWGKSWERGSVSLIGSYQERGELLGVDREPWSLTSFPANLSPATVAAIASTSCSPGNVYSVDGTNLPGLNSAQAAIPAGITGRPTIGQFQATAGGQNLCNIGRYTDITPQTQRESALLSAHYELSQFVDLFTDVLFSYQHLRYQIASQITVYQGYGGTVAADNPYNPFGEAVNVSFEYPGTGYVQDDFTSLLRPTIGVRGTLASDWHYEATVSVSRAQFHYVTPYADYQSVSAALASSNPATALNPFTTGPPGTPQLLNSLINPAETLYDSFDDRTVSGQVLLRGPLLQLPAGALQAVIGSEYSQEKQDAATTGYPSFLLHRNSYAAFTEARIPLLAWGEHSQADERLALSVAGRYDCQRASKVDHQPACKIDQGMRGRFLI